MARNSLPLLSRAQAAGSSAPTATPPQSVPTFRFISATPSVAGTSAGPDTSFDPVAPFASSPLAPRSDSDAPRKRLVPKKSKLGLLSGTSKTKDKGTKDFSDVVRRVGGGSTNGKGGFEIYVDHADDPDIGEIVVVKKKKSRLGLEGMGWGALGEVTNVPSASQPKEKAVPSDNLLKVKGDDSLKWWSIRGRKDSKEKAKENKTKTSARSKTPEPSKPLESRARFNSLNASTLLSVPEPNQGSVRSVTSPMQSSNGLLAPPSTDEPNTGSLAIRAMRSVRSIARMKSWATLSGTTTNTKEGNKNTPSASTNTNATNSNDKTKEKGEEKKKKKKKEKTEKTVRYSGSSFEAGALSPIEGTFPASATMKKKQSILGLGLPSSMRRTVRNVSTTSSVSSAAPPPATTNRLSVDSAHLILNAAGRPSSVVSSGSSLRPPSTASGVSVFSERSPRSSSSSMVSVRWDEEGLQHAKELQRKERRAKRDSADSTGTGDKRTSKESRRSSEARRRTPISEIFPETVQRPPSVVSNSTGRSSLTGPVVNIEEATVDGHSDHGEDAALETPMKKARARPVSEQLLGKTRPQCIYEESDGVISILDAATNDLASLINRLDLEATPASSIGSPLRLSPLASFDSPAKAALPKDESPVKRRSLNKDQVLPPGGLRESMASISSLRPYAHAQSLSKLSSTRAQQNPGRIGQQIAPWSELDWEISPKKPVVRKPITRPTHKRTMSPTPALDPPPVFQPLQPAKRNVSPILTKGSTPLTATPIATGVAEPSSKTFGSKTSKIGVEPSLELDDEPAPSPCPVFKRHSGHVRSGSIASVLGHKQSQRSPLTSMFIASEARKSLGLTGTLGGSASTEPCVDPEDPDSDIPDELQVIIAGQSDDESTRNFDDTISFHRISAPSSPVEPAHEDLPVVALPVDTQDETEAQPIFRAQLIDEEANQADLDDSGNVSSDDDTNKSFDFTGELKKLNESGASDRRSFVEQLENAFRTPARIDLGLDDGFLKASVPPVPPLPLNFRKTPPEDLVPRSVSVPDVTTTTEENVENSMEPPYQNTGDSDTLEHLLAECQDDICRPYPEMRRSNDSMRSKASDGQLNTGFKFGGKLSVPPPVPEQTEKPLTLSDIIPPPSHYLPRAGSMMLEDDSVFNSIMAHAAEMPPPTIRQRANSDASHKRGPSGEFSRLSYISSRSRTTSEASFTGLESFDEIRRGFEFGPNRPTFYPPPGAGNTSSRSWASHKKFESIYSIASVSSFGSVLDSGSVDPFGYLHNRPISDDMSVSMSMDVDDTFSFIHKGKRRQRVDSDTSSFYFRAPGASQASWQTRRGHRRQDSTMSTFSNAPPVSIYNKSFGAHRRNDSTASASSVAHSYAMYPGGRASWARHRADPSIDSVSSEYSALRLGRPGIGDKMFDRDYGMPLTAISASPPESVSGEPTNQPSNWDSIIDGHRTSADDSLFEKTGYKTTYDDDEFVFGFDGNNSDPGHLPANHFRPLSMMSVGSIHSAPRDDDTMITMIGGGHVRRRSVDSLIEASPLVKMGMEKRKQALSKVARVLKFDQDEHMPPPPVPKLPSEALTKSPLAPKPSIASTSSYQFGGERMIKAKQGLLERQSLEEGALIAQGEEILTTLRSRAVFSRPGPASRSRSSTITESSGAETPPLSCSDTSSVSGGSQSSIDLGHLNTLLTASTRPTSGIAGARARQRARGTGHRRRISQARMSRSSVYETIEEESYVFSSSPSPARPSLPSVPASLTKAIASPQVRDSVYIVDSDTQSLVSFSEDWDDERGIVGLRRYYALRDEADHTVTESKRVWQDTPFSVFAVQSFQPPYDKSGMQAMLEHSKQNYGPLPSELRPYRVRSRTSSRASPYPVRALKSTFSPEHTRSPRSSRVSMVFEDYSAKSFVSFDPNQTAPLTEVTRNVNVISPPPVLEVKAFTPFAVNVSEVVKPEKNTIGVPPRPRVTSSARRTALGWSKRSTGKSSSSKEQKENISQGTLATPGESLRLSRPRPRGRPTPARAPVALRG